MIKKVIHISDIHIKNNDEYEKFKENLELFINQVKNEVIDYEYDEIRIVIAGDLVHENNTVTNELYLKVYEFLSELEKIGKVIAITGNHDTNVRSKNKRSIIDSAHTIMKLENFRNLDYELNRKSGYIIDENIIWSVYSIYDGFNEPIIPNEIRKGKKIIGLFHGPLIGSKTDLNHDMDRGCNINMFTNCHCAMIGDIHKRQVLVNDKGIDIVYSGSLYQQNKGENVSGHGYVIWDIDSLEFEFKDVNIEYGLYKVKMNTNGDCKWVNK